MRLYQRHTLDIVLRQSLMFGKSLEQIAPPESFLGGLALRNVNREIVRQRRGIDLIPDQSQIEQASRHELVLDYAALAEMQSTWPHPRHSFRALNGYFLFALLVVIA